MFTMEIYNQLTPDDITGGKRIAGTGTVNLDGKVGQIGGVKFKVMAAEKAGADLFIVPTENYEQAQEAQANIPLLEVENIDDIIEYFTAEEKAA